jgi:hypothetical protein
MAAARTRSKQAKRQPTALASVKTVAAEAPAPAGERERLIALAAYYRAERRGFEPGRELEDWLEAEAEVDATLRARRAPR